MTSYVRFQNAQGKVHCALLLSKARVNPLKKTTIPRLELTAATVAVRLSKVIERELDYQVDCIYFWTDSQSVLKYLFSHICSQQSISDQRSISIEPMAICQIISQSG